MSRIVGSATNKLTSKQYLQVVDTLRAEKDKILEKRPTKDALAADLTKRLGFPITKGNVIGIADTIGLEWRAKGEHGGPSGGANQHTQRRAALEAKVDTHEKRIVELERVVAELRGAIIGPENK